MQMEPPRHSVLHTGLCEDVRGLVYASSLHDKHPLTALELYQITSIRSLHYQGRFFMQLGGALTPYRWITHKLPQLGVTRCASGIPIIFSGQPHPYCRVTV